MDEILFARIGAVCYGLWGLVHYDAVYTVYHIAIGVFPPSIVQGRLFQGAFYLFAFSTIGIVALAQIGQLLLQHQGQEGTEHVAADRRVAGMIR